MATAIPPDDRIVAAKESTEFDKHRQIGNYMNGPCEHLKNVTEANFPPPRTPNACEECLKEGTQWVALRECLICGHVGCCDSSPGKHATRHFHVTGHPVMRSVMPGDRWTWCYVHEVAGQLGPAPAGTKQKA